MRFHPLGHAMGLAEIDGLRLLFDPLLTDRHHGGVFEVTPPRELDVDALCPDFLFVSHRHPDHFDIASLRRLAELDPDTVVITPDSLVARTCERLGFRTVRSVPPNTRVELDTVRLQTTPSRANERPIAPEALEWGVALHGDGAIVWNQVDTVHASVGELLRTVDGFESTLAAELAMTLVRWSPLLEVEASLAGRIGFPLAAYAEIVEQAAALGERGSALVPSSAGARHAEPWSSMNALVYPVDEARFLRDLAARAPSSRSYSSGVGGVFEITGDGVGFEQTGTLVTTRPAIDDRSFRPLEIRPLVDPNLAGRSESQLRVTIDTWIDRTLAPATAGPRTYVLEVVYPSTTEHWTLGTAVARRDDRGWDVRNAIAASLLCEVIEGRRHWGDVLLAGALRACSRAYDVRAAGVAAARTSLIFLYDAISYSESVERAVEHEVRACASSSVRTSGRGHR